MIAWFACLMSTHRQISPLFFGTISTGLTQGAGPSTGSIIPMSNSSVVLSRIFPLRLNGILLKGCAIGFTVGSISRDICLFFKFPTPSNTYGYCCFKLSALLATIAMLRPTFNTPSSVAVIFPSRDIPLPYWQWLTRRIWVQLLFWGSSLWFTFHSLHL